MSNAPSAIEQVKTTIQSMEKSFTEALPPHIPAKKFVKTVLMALANNPDIAKVENRQSLYAACMKAAQDGLVLDGREAALVSFGSTVQYMPMVGGIIKKVRNSGELKMIDAQEVFENDKFESWVDERGQHFRHEKARKDRGNPILTYAYAIMKDDAVYYEEMDEEQIASVEKVSRAKGTIWKGPFRGEMKRKTVIRRLSKRLPMSADMDNVIRAVDEDYDLAEPDVKQEPIIEGKKETKAASVIKGYAEPVMDADIPSEADDMI